LWSIIKAELRKIGFGGVDWIYLAEDGDRWRASVNTIMNLGFHKMREIY
jgi:hypothetical protein